MLSVEPIPAFDDNYIWLLREGRDAVVVDPGDADPVLETLEREGLALRAILLTHHHGDHIGGVEDILARHPVAVYAPHDPRIACATHRVAHGDTVSLAGPVAEFRVIECPGHTSSHVAYYGAKALFCGDTLFACGCGRLFEGTPAQMHESLARFTVLPGDTAVYCAHEYTLANIRFARAVEPDSAALAERERSDRARRERDEPTVPSTLALEAATNPFLRCTEAAVVAAASRVAGRPLGSAVDVFAAIREWKNRF